MKFHFGIAGYAASQFHLLLMALTIAKTQCHHSLEVLFCPKEASGGVLSAAIYH